MTATGDAHKRTIAFANLALGQIRILGQPADPRSYAVWFTYATGCTPSRNTVINETVARTGTISTAELEEIYGYPTTDCITDDVDKLATGVAGHLEQVMAMIDAAVGTVAIYRDGLTNVAQRLDRVRDREGLRGVVKNLVRATRGMEATNQALAASLKASKQEINQLQDQVEALRIESLTDPLTSLANRKFFDRELDRFIAKATTQNEPLCLLLIDVDQFKRINDTFGHKAAEEVLRAVGHAIQQHVQADDVAARMGGEEFAIILPKTQLRSALAVADHVRCRVMGMQFIKRSSGESLDKVTVSVGIAAYRRGETAWTLVHRADNSLHAAKRGGRNRVICDNDSSVAAVA